MGVAAVPLVLAVPYDRRASKWWRRGRGLERRQLQWLVWRLTPATRVVARLRPGVANAATSGYPDPMASLPEHLKSTPVGREHLPREVLAEHQRERVLVAAAEVFAKRGYQGTTVDHIVAAAKIGVGSFYSLFEGKEECFLGTYDQIVSAARERMIAALPADGSWPHRLMACLRTLLAMIEAEPLSARIALVEVQTAGAAALQRHQHSLDEAAALLRGGREHSPFAGELPASLEFATVGGLAWFLQQRIGLGETGGATELLPEAMEIVAEPYLGAAETAKLVAAA
jgi:AcrR family transcriptional regulator